MRERIDRICLSITNGTRADQIDLAYPSQMHKSGCERVDARELSLVKTGHMTNGSRCTRADARADARGSH